MDAIQNLLMGFAIALTPQNIMFAFLGSVLGTFIGVLPGIGPVAGVAMLIPLTFQMTPTGAIIMLTALFYGTQYGGTITSVLLNVPGEAASAITCIEGYEMAKQEEEIKRTAPTLLSTVIKVPHHGSKTSSTPELVESVRPKFAVFTVRAGGRNRLPHLSVLQRYEDRGVKALLSDRDGAITFATKGQDLQVRTFIGDKKGSL